jgi:hypothetical protein
MSSETSYTLPGFADRHTPTVATNVTIDQTKDLNGCF